MGSTVASLCTQKQNKHLKITRTRSWTHVFMCNTPTPTGYRRRLWSTRARDFVRRKEGGRRCAEIKFEHRTETRRAGTVQNTQTNQTKCEAWIFIQRICMIYQFSGVVGPDRKHDVNFLWGIHQWQPDNREHAFVVTTLPRTTLAPSFLNHLLKINLILLISFHYKTNHDVWSILVLPE